MTLPTDPILAAISTANASGVTLSLIRQTSQGWEARAHRPLPPDRAHVPEAPKRYLYAVGSWVSPDLLTAIRSAATLCLTDYDILTWEPEPYHHQPATSLLALLNLPATQQPASNTIGLRRI